MPSRINMGPDGGPYIAINENSGDIELEDNSGNVVAKWDETNTQWDFSSNDIQNVGSLDVDLSSVTEVAGRASLTTDQTVPSSTVTEVDLDSVNIEDTDIVTVDLPNNQISIAESGKYVVYGLLRFDGSNDWATGDRIQLRVNVNGAKNIESNIHHGGTNEIISTDVQRMNILNSGDTLSLSVFHTSTSDEVLFGGSSAVALEVRRIG
jgi:hypothetical protein